ncbi:MAG: agmatine deiminase family protein, partial [Myxococcales bacterium]|nr:agmatine deiminase family protein [Myxococcales bacterium]
SYTNALAVNGRVLVPVYDEDTRYQNQALAVFKQAYPNHDIVPINSDGIIYWSGAIHCVTMTLAD